MRIVGQVGIVVVALGACLGSPAVEAGGKYDGAVPMLCSPTVVEECGADGDCRRGTPASVNLPEFFKVDLKTMKVYAEGTGRESPIRNVEHLNGHLIVQGGQNGRGWSMAIAEETGKMSAAIATSDEGFLVFGACVAP